MGFFKTKQTVQEDDIRHPFSTKLPSDLQKLKLIFKEDERKDVPRKYLEIVFDECLELMNLRQVIKLIGQYKLAIQQGMNEQEEEGKNNQIQKAKKRMNKTNYQLFAKFQLKPQQPVLLAQKLPSPQSNSEELSNKLIQLNQTRLAINLLSELIGKALKKQQVLQQLPKIEHLVPKQMHNMLTLLRSHLDLKQPLEAVQSDFVKKLKKIDEAFFDEQGAIEDHHDDNQINYLYGRISTFIDKNQASLKNLHMFNKDIVDSLRNFIRQILQPLQRKKQEEIDFVHILTDSSDIKNELQRVLASYKDYLQENDKNSQEMELQIEKYQAQDGKNKKKVQNLQKDKQDYETHIKRITKEIKQRQTEVDEVKKRLASTTQAHHQTNSDNDAISIKNKQLEEENKSLKNKLSSIRNKLKNLNLQRKKIQSEQASLKQELQAKLSQQRQHGRQQASNAFTLLAQIAEQRQEIQRKIQQQTTLIEKLVTSNNQSSAMIQKLNSILSESQELYNQQQILYEQSEAKLTEQLNKLQKLNQQSQQQLTKADVDLKQANNNTQSLLFLHKQLKEEKDKEKAENAEKMKKLSHEVQSLKKANSSLKLEINETRRRQADALRYNEELLKKISNERDYERYFAHQVLYDFGFYKKAIINTIENRNYLQVKATRLLFRFDPLNKVNFHRYIDEIPHILLLVKLENGRMLACYTNQPFKPQCTGEDAFIMVLSTGNTYELKKGTRAISYDEYYILFGNSEIRLRSGENLIFSNFGIANSNFDNKNQNVDALFGEGKDKRELPISGYEIYQIIFEEEQ